MTAQVPAYDYATFPRKFISYRWFKPLLVAVLAGVFMLLFQLVVIVAAAIAAGDPNFLDHLGTGYDDMDFYDAPGAIAEIGAIAVMLPALALAVGVVRDRPYSSLSSSRGGWNWGLFGLYLVIAAVIYAVTCVFQYVIFPSGAGDGVVRFTLGGIIACAIVIPIQCVAEEYVFRGFILQTVGAWTKLPALAIIVSAIAFAAGHPYNDIGVISILINGIIWGIVAWQTKGLEATSALHIVNNYVAFYCAGFGLDPATSEITVESLVVALVIDVVFAVIVIALGKRFNWFDAKKDGTVAFNRKKAEKIARKNKRRAKPWPGVPAAQPVQYPLAPTAPAQRAVPVAPPSQPWAQPAQWNAPQSPAAVPQPAPAPQPASQPPVAASAPQVAAAPQPAPQPERRGKYARPE